jgi:excisionase family DNA binding protein
MGRLPMTDPNRRFGFSPHLLTVPEVAEILRVSPRTVRRMIDDKRLPVVRFGRAVRVRVEALTAFIGEAK